MSETDTAKPRERPASPRRVARQIATQLLYAWLVNPTSEGDTLRDDARSEESFGAADAKLLDRLLVGVPAHAASLREALSAMLDRPVAELSPVEHAILLIGAEELTHHPDTPYRVIINEAIELAKTFGGTDGHKYVNGVLDRFAMQVRPDEARTRRGP